MAPLLLVWTLALGLAWAKTTWTVPSGPWPRWTVGDIQTIEYTTTETEYTIALWQQLDGAGTLGPILFRMFSPSLSLSLSTPSLLVDTH